MKLAIVGIDPGTTTGIAAIGLRGELLLLKSMKNPRIGDVSKTIVDSCRPIIIAGDVNPPPKMLEKLAAVFSAKVFFPKENMERLDKIEIAESYSKKVNPEGRVWANRHERDALASALRAWKRVRHIIDRAYDSTMGLGEETVGKVMLCVLNEGRPIEECKRRFL
jgi:predicted RNase H-like nuclease (RuvC/YqgF family)